MNLNISDLDPIDFSNTAAGHALEGFQDNRLTTQDIIEICGAMDVSALFIASTGLLSSLIYMFYVVRWRDGCSVRQKAFFDKMGLVLIALLFVGIIVRIARAG